VRAETTAHAHTQAHYTEVLGPWPGNAQLMTIVGTGPGDLACTIERCVCAPAYACVHVCVCVCVCHGVCMCVHVCVCTHVYMCVCSMARLLMLDVRGRPDRASYLFFSTFEAALSVDLRLASVAVEVCADTTTRAHTHTHTHAYTDSQGHADTDRHTHRMTVALPPTPLLCLPRGQNSKGERLLHQNDWDAVDARRSACPSTPTHKETRTHTDTTMYAASFLALSLTFPHGLTLLRRC
jgi:hypothetical protein